MKERILLFFLFLSIGIQSQNLKTIQFKPVNGDSFLPITTLGKVLELSFDDLDADNKEYQYKVEHMTYNWTPSDLIPNQYINGFDNDYINNITNSFNTLQDYTHYSLKIPNKNTIITKSGNYILYILNEDDEVIFKRRFVLYEPLTTIAINVNRSRELKRTNEQQTLQLLVNYPKISINNPTQEINITIFQNNNWNTAINNLKPQSYKPKQLIYNYVNKTNFKGGNEFLNFDTKNIRNTNLNIARVERKDVFNNYLYTNEPRKNKPYTYNPDINGSFVIRTLESEDENTEADYATIYFTLDVDKPYKNKEVYIYGGFNNYNFSKKNKMSYNNHKKLYEASISLKQGFYNYGFATIDSNETIDLTEVDGSFYETENEYTAIVYYRTFGSNYDRAIGVGTAFFNQNN